MLIIFLLLTSSVSYQILNIRLGGLEKRSDAACMEKSSTFPFMTRVVSDPPSLRSNSGVKLPEILEVFPEFRLPWPKWLKNKNGNRIPCETDKDCPFPLACCYHPILPYEQYCCSGWNKRILVRQYIYNFIK